MRGRSAGPTLCVVMPALNEEEGILDAIDAATTVLDRLRADLLISSYELVIVDDGSTDATAAIVETIAAGQPTIRLLRHGRNRGVGRALQTAIESTECDLLLSTDADMPVDLGRLAEAIPLLDHDEVGLVAGHRSSFDREPAFRRAIAGIYDRVIRVVIGVRVRDVNFPFKLLATETARSLDIRSEGALVDVELLAKVKGLRLEIAPLEMTYHARVAGESKTMRPKLLLRLLGELIEQRSTLRACARAAP